MKLLIICLVLSITTFVNAQDATNDATWEETTSFIEKYSTYIKKPRTNNGDCSWKLQDFKKQIKL